MSEFKNKFCILLAAPRSGTQLLGEAAAMSFGTNWLQEVFHEQYSEATVDLVCEYEVSKKASFFNFRYHRFRENLTASYPSELNQRTLFLDYLRSLPARFGEGSFLLDVKYNSLHHLNDYWSFFFDPPGLIKLVRELEIPVVHVVRNNLFAQYCSVQLAQTTGIWYSRVPLERSPRLCVDVKDCEYRMQIVERTSALVDQWCDGHPSHRICYESMIDSEGFSPATSKAFVDIFGKEPTSPLMPLFHKVSPPLREVITNADEVRRHFLGSKYSEMVDQALA